LILNVSVIIAPDIFIFSWNLFAFVSILRIGNDKSNKKHLNAPAYTCAKGKKSGTMRGMGKPEIRAVNQTNCNVSAQLTFEFAANIRFAGKIEAELVNFQMFSPI